MTGELEKTAGSTDTPTDGSVEKSLPGGVSIRFPAKSVEADLVGFIEDPSKTPDKSVWFSFDRLEFETGSAVLKPSSQEQLKNVAAILAAYPAVKVKIGGYTDNTGDPAANMKLSSERAMNTMNELAKLGVASDRMESEGYGDQHPVADNATEEGRQKNRRIDINVTAK
jgi:outer membrane protein OmpA-like peptidoglycan-associated protein